MSLQHISHQADVACKYYFRPPGGCDGRAGDLEPARSKGARYGRLQDVCLQTAVLVAIALLPMLHGKSGSLTVATYNIHKGFSHFNRRMVVHDMRERLRMMGADILFLQEVVGHNARHVENHETWPDTPQHEFLAEAQWPAAAYAKNAIYVDGHHGNAILSRYPMIRCDHEDISTNRLEKRGLLHAEIEVPEWGTNLHCVCVHLGLFGRSRRKQVDLVCARIEALVPKGAPLVLAGDFNDWGHRIGDPLRALGVHEVFETMKGRPARSFPARLPILRLDRIYVRGFSVQSVDVHRGAEWARLSDHAPLAAHLVRE